MVKLIILVGAVRNIKKFWEAKTSKRERIFVGEEEKGRINGISFTVQKGQVIDRETKEVATLNILSIITIKEFSADIAKLSAKFGISPREIMIIISRKDSTLVKKIFPEKVSGRYHWCDFGWMVVLKGLGKFSEVSEIVAIFSKGNENQTLLHAVKKYNKRKFYSQINFHYN